MGKKNYERFELTMTKAQKEIIEKAQSISGYSTRKQLVLEGAVEYAKKIIQEHESILSNERDRIAFFEALSNPQKPNEALSKLAKYYGSELSE